MALTTNLQGYWKLDESTGNAADSSGNGSTLTNTNTVVYTAGKINNGGLLVRATPSYFKCADNTALSITGDISVSLWINLTATASVVGDNMQLISKWQDSSNRDYRMLIGNDNTLNFAFTSGGTGAQSDFGTGAQITSSGVWYHIVATLNPSGGSSTGLFYVNGSSVSITSHSGAATSIHDGTSSFVLGIVNPDGTPVEPLGGILDEVGIWSRVLSSTEVTALYNSGNGLQYPFGESAGPANLKSYNTNLKANIKSINTNLIANVKSLDTNV